ncbi:hypothetical protein F5X99DRAFT_393804 [Biscogniauxia marginata]|nr:hypothetical protein F5X99DRAFT_393804 [Biscogniauxia marginata]
MKQQYAVIEKSGWISAIMLSAVLGRLFTSGWEVWTGLSPTEEYKQKDYTAIRWNLTRLGLTDNVSDVCLGTEKLTSMRDVITVLVPYLMFCGGFPTTLSHTASFIILILYGLGLRVSK